jgi:hypothetical protein
MASIQHTVELLDTTTAFDEQERSMWKFLLPSMTKQRIGMLTQVMEGHESRLKVWEAKHGKKAIIDWNEHISEGKDIIEALRPGYASTLAIQKGCAD